MVVVIPKIQENPNNLFQWPSPSPFFFFFLIFMSLFVVAIVIVVVAVDGGDLFSLLFLPWPLVERQMKMYLSYMSRFSVLLLQDFMGWLKCLQSQPNGEREVLKLCPTDQCVGLQYRRAAHAPTTSSTAVRPWGQTSARAGGGGAGHGGNSGVLLLTDQAGSIGKTRPRQSVPNSWS